MKPLLILPDNIRIDADELARIMNACWLSPAAMGRITVYIDPTFHLSLNGSAWPSYLARFRFPRLPRHGNVVRISTQMRGKPRSAAAMNQTLVHELEHIAQIERKDIRMFIGHATILAAVLCGITVGLWAHSLLLAILGGLVGEQLGYLIALHEIQARKRARTVTTSAISLGS